MSEDLGGYWHSVIDSLRDGNLQPLANWIRDGFSIDGEIAIAIADAIDGPSPIQLVAKKRSQDRRDWSEREQEVLAEIKMGCAALKLLHAEPGLDYDTVCSDVAERFKALGYRASRSKVAKALAKAKQVAENGTVSFGDVHTWFLFVDVINRELRGFSPNPKRRVRRTKLVK